MAHKEPVSNCRSRDLLFILQVRRCLGGVRVKGTDLMQELIELMVGINIVWSLL